MDVVVIGGGGHVGLPLSIVLARSHRVFVYDTSAERVHLIGQGRMPFEEVGAREALEQAIGRSLFATTDPEVIGKGEVVIVVIGTPVGEYGPPDMSAFEDLAWELEQRAKAGALVMLRSTVYPGTTEYLARRLEGMDVVFCPERIVEGRAMTEITALPQIVGADTPRARRRAIEFWEDIVEDVVPVKSKEAELAKLVANTWRYVKFAAANEFARIATEAGIDYDRVLHAVRYRYERASDLPRPGFAAGPCLFKDSMQISAFAGEATLVQAAMQANSQMPEWIVGRARSYLGGFEGTTVGILGLTFKGDSDDLRDSLATKLRWLLEWEGATVLVADPYVPGTDAAQEVIDRSDLVIIGAPHHAFADLDYDLVIDPWGITGRIML